MTITVAIKCTSGVAVAADSMLTVGSMAQQRGQKIHVLPGATQQLFAFAGDLGMAERFRAVATEAASAITQQPHKLSYAITVGGAFVQNVRSTGMDFLKIDLAGFLGFVKDNEPEICIFAAGSQPRFLDRHHHSCAVGSGAVAANPFLKFLSDVFLHDRQPTLAEGKFLAAWAVKYAIQTMSGGVGGDIDMAVIESDAQNGWQIRELDRQDIGEILQAAESAIAALKNWASALSTPSNAEEVPVPAANDPAQNPLPVEATAQSS